MNLKLFLTIFFAFTLSHSAQDRKAEMVLDFGDIQCSYFINIVPVALNRFNEIPDAKMYLIYYEGKHYTSSVWNEKLRRREPKLTYPKRGNALNRAKEIGLFLEEYEFSQNNLILIDGGFREKLALEFWIVPNGVEPPKPTPTVDEKDVKFSKGKPFKTRECARIYDGL